jgi:pimeloyl-ACP methyl ester carboxylesterase
MIIPPVPYISRFFSASDGLKLHMRDYGGSHTTGAPVVCLTGLTRNSADFDLVARALASGQAGPKRRVVALDYRGRGLSDYDPNWKNYTLPVESNDIATVLAGAGIDQAIFIGTSRGGLHIMLLAATRPALLRAAVLNDIGPVLELQGMKRIRGYVGKFAPPTSSSEAIAVLKKIMGEDFTGLREADWEAYAHNTFANEKGEFGLRCDPQLMKQLEGLDLDQPIPPTWPQFDALRDVPLLLIRGANSDLLSQATLNEMVDHQPQSETYIVEGQGHAPLLLDEGSIARICGFVAKVDGLRPS